MYTGHFSLREAPFAITPDPRYLYFGERHTEALAHLSYGVAEDGGFVLLTGEVGTGKTTLVRRLLGRLPEDMDVALVLNPRLTVAEFVATVCEELGVAVDPAERSLKRLVDALNRHLLEVHAAGRRTIVLVDEAQNLLPDVLEQVRLLTNLETERRKLLRLVLVGQPELRDLVARDDMRQLRQRVTTRYHLEPLSADETESYIRHRIEVAGGDPRLFSRGAARAVYRRTGGIPRLINILSDRAMLAAYADGRIEVDRGAVARAWDEMEDRGSSRGRGLAWAAAATLVLVLGIAVAGWLMLEDDRFPAATASEGAAPVETPPEGAASVGAASVGATSVGAASVGATSVGAASAANETDSNAETAPPVGATSVGAASAANRADAGAQFNGTLPTADRDTALRRVLATWGRSVAPGLDPCEVAGSAGFRCSTRTGSWRNLTVLDLPAVLELADGSHAALVGTDGPQLILAAQAETVRVPRSAVDERWFGEFTVIWRPEDGLVATLYPGERDPRVPALRRQLRQVLGQGSDATLGAATGDVELYDAGLRTAVARFQRDRRLKVDGIAGPQTLMVLAGAVGASGRPRLSEGNGGTTATGAD